MHSAVRRIGFGAEQQFEKFLGYYAASFLTTDYPHREELTYMSYAAPGRQISRYALRGNRSAFLFVFSRDSPFPEHPDKAAAKEIVREILSNVSEILACMGVIDRFLAKGETPTSVNILVGNHQFVRLKFEASGKESGRDAFRPKAIVIPQSETEKILGEVVRERGGQIEWNTEFVEFRQNEDGVVSRIRAEGTRSVFES